MENFFKYEAMGKILLKDLAEELNDPDNIQRSARTMKSVLYAITNMLSFDQSIEFLKNVPLYAKGIEQNGWTIGNNNVENVETVDDLSNELRNIDHQFAYIDFPSEKEAQWAIKSVFRVLCWHTDQEKMLTMTHLLPKSLRDFLQDSAVV